MKKVIGVIGTLHAGKDVVGNYLSQQLHLPTYQISDELRLLAKEQDIYVCKS